MLALEPGFSLSDIDAAEVDEVGCDFSDVVEVGEVDCDVLDVVAEDIVECLVERQRI